jgi:hypothetical protein
MLTDIIGSEDISSSAVSNWIATLSSLVQSPQELDEQALSNIGNACQTIINGAIESALDYSELIKVMEVLNIVLDLQSSYSATDNDDNSDSTSGSKMLGRRKRKLSTGTSTSTSSEDMRGMMGNFTTNMNLMSDSILTNMLIGEDAVSVVEDTFRMTTSATSLEDGTNTSFPIAFSDLETLSETSVDLHAVTISASQSYPNLKLAVSTKVSKFLAMEEDSSTSTNTSTSTDDTVSASRRTSRRLLQSSLPAYQRLASHTIRRHHRKANTITPPAPSAAMTSIPHSATNHSANNRREQASSQASSDSMGVPMVPTASSHDDVINKEERDKKWYVNRFGLQRHLESTGFSGFTQQHYDALLTHHSGWESHHVAAHMRHTVMSQLLSSHDMKNSRRLSVATNTSSTGEEVVSSSLSVRLSCSDTGMADELMYFTMYHDHELVLEEDSYEAPLNFTTTCLRKHYNSETYYCPVTDEYFTVQCRGLKEQVVTVCPAIQRVSKCGNVDPSNGIATLSDDMTSGLNCTRVAEQSDSSKTVCACMICDSSSVARERRHSRRLQYAEEISRRLSSSTSYRQPSKHRLLSSSSDDEEVELTTMITFVATQYADVMSQAGAYSGAEAIMKTAIILIFFAVIWFGMPAWTYLHRSLHLQYQQLGAEKREQEREDTRKAAQLQLITRSADIEDMQRELMKKQQEFHVYIAKNQSQLHDENVSFAQKTHLKEIEKKKQMELDVLQKRLDVESAHVARDRQNAVTNRFVSYVSSILPEVYDTTKTSFQRFWGVLVNNHLYSVVLNEKDLLKASIIIAHNSSVMTLLCFLLALLYDLQFPSDDGSCALNGAASEEACHSMVTPFNSDEQLCQWDAVYSECNYLDREISFSMYAYMSMILTIIVIPFHFLIDFSFNEILLAPTAREMDVKISEIENKTTRLLGIARRMSNQILNLGRRMSNAANAAGNVVTSMFAKQKVEIEDEDDMNDGRTKRRTSSKFVAPLRRDSQIKFMSENIIVSDDTTDARELVYSALHANTLAQTTLAKVKNGYTKDKHGNQHHHNKHGNNNKNLIKPRDVNINITQRLSTLSKEVDQAQNTKDNALDQEDRKGRGLSLVSKLAMNRLERHQRMKSMRCTLVSEEIMRLQADLIKHRSSIKYKELCLLFDSQWTIMVNDRANQVSTTEAHKKVRYALSTAAQQHIHGEIDKVLKETISAEQRISRLPNVFRGPELLRIFILDLIGRHSNEGKIIKMKMYESSGKRVVSFGLKCLTVSVLFVLNLFMIFSILLYGLDKGQDWQQSWMVTAVANVVIEIVFNQFTEVAMIHYFLPSLLLAQVVLLRLSLYYVVETLFNSKKSTTSTSATASASSSEEYQFSGTDFLFVSARLAQLFPDLEESAMILSYRTCLPGVVSKKWLDEETLREAKKQELVDIVRRAKNCDEESLLRQEVCSAEETILENIQDRNEYGLIEDGSSVLNSEAFLMNFQDVDPRSREAQNFIQRQRYKMMVYSAMRRAGQMMIAFGIRIASLNHSLQVLLVQTLQPVALMGLLFSIYTIYEHIVIFVMILTLIGVLLLYRWYNQWITKRSKLMLMRNSIAPLPEEEDTKKNKAVLSDILLETAKLNDVSFKDKGMETQQMRDRRKSGAFSMNRNKDLNKSGKESASQRRTSNLFSLGSYKDNTNTAHKSRDYFLDTESLTDRSMADDDDDSLSVSSASSATSSSDSDTDVTSVNTSSISLTETLMSVTSRATGMSKIYSIAPDSANSKSSSSSTGSSSDSSYSNIGVPQYLHEPLSNAMQGLQRHEKKEVIGQLSNLRTLIDDMKAMKEEGRKKDAVLIQQTVLAANDAIEIEN